MASSLPSCVSAWRPAIPGPTAPAAWASPPTGVRAQSQPVLWRLTYLAAGPVMPLILLARKTRTVFAKRCRVKQFVRALPLTLIALVVFVAGEWVGCLLGPGDALSRVE